MCLAIYKPPKLVIPEDYLKEGWLSNPDGAGIAFIKKKKVVIEKGFMKYKEFLDAYKEAFNTHKNSPFLIHFRTRTQGYRDTLNTHPFEIIDGAAIHNGFFNGTQSSTTQADSDTNIFFRKFGPYLDYDTIEKHKQELEAKWGHNKVVFLYNDGRFQIINAAAGVWENDVWYSNSSYRRSASMNLGWNHRTQSYGQVNPYAGIMGEE